MKKTFSLFLVICSIAQASIAQQVELVEQWNTPTVVNGRSYIYTKGVTLLGTSGITISAAQHGAVFIRPAEAAKIPKNVAPSMDKNFVRVEDILVEGITSVDQIGGLDYTKKNTSYQYVDGVGRSMQDLVVKGSPLGYDVIKPYAYNSHGRQAKDYKPYSSSSGQSGLFVSAALTNQATFFTNTPQVPSDSRPYSEFDFELSPLNRINEAFGPGALWKNGMVSKGVKSLSQINVSGTVRRWTISAGLPTTNSTYPAGTLFYNTSTDEDGNNSRTYVDIRGNVVMKEDNGLITYYVYDEIGRLRFVLPPELVNDYPSNVSSVTIGETLLKTWAFQYKYDVRGRLYEEKGPGPDNDWVYYVYDQWDRLVLKQDGAQRAKSPKECSFIKYDALNRPIITGIVKTTSGADHDALKNAVSGGQYETENTSTLGYTIESSFPTITGVITAREVLTITYYDDYSFLTISGWSESNPAYSPDAGLGSLSTIKGSVTGTKIKVLDQTTWLTSVTYYDKQYNPIQTIQRNHLTAVPERITNTYNFAGWVTQTKRVHYNYNASGTTTILEDYEYDHMGRLKRVYHRINSEPLVLLASYDYNEAGQLVEKNLHSTNTGSSFLQSVDYRYNIRGWLTSINNSSLTNDGIKNDDSNDLFGMELTYNEEILTINGAATNRKYNGTITAARWKTNDQKNPPKERGYGYHYNSKNWIEKAEYATKNGSNWTDEGGFYNLEGLQYDDNGNIRFLKRYGKSGSSRVLIDDLTYVYGSNGNQLTAVEEGDGNNFGYPDKTSGISPELEYDKNGNLKSDLNAEMTSVTYNALNLPSIIVIDLPNTNADYQIEFTYDASGYLLKRLLKKGGVVIKAIDYVQGIQYYDQSLAIIFTPEGRATKYNGAFEYEYFLKDHLTNTRTVFGYVHDTDVYEATMESELADDEDDDFKNLEPGSISRVPLHNITSATMDVPVPNESIMLNGYSDINNPAEPIGPAKILTVKAGDRVYMEAFARYNTTVSGNAVITNLVTAVTGAFEVYNAGETQAAYQALNTNLPIYQAVRGTDAPKAYLYYILFDNNYVYKQFGYSEVKSTALVAHQKLFLDIPIPSDGHMYIYLANESQISAATAVYFDDFKIVHEKITNSLRVTEVNDYDPFGHIIEGTRFVDVSRSQNNYQYQGKFAEFDGLVGWNRFMGRGNYDSRLGRWHSTDAANQGSSPYQAMGNRPITNVDPDGQFFVPVIIGAAMGAYQAHQSGGDWWKGAITGAVGGGLGSFAPYGMLPGLGYGALSGAAIGTLDAALNKKNFGNSALNGAVAGGIIGGLSGGLRAGLNGRDLYSGIKYSRFQTGDVPLGPYFEEPTSENLEELSDKKFGDQPYENGVRKLKVSTKPDPDAYYDKNDQIFRDKVDKGAILGYTKYGAFGNKSDAIVPPGTFRTSPEVVTGILGHEYVHISHYFFLGFPTNASVDASEYAAWKWTANYYEQLNNAYWLGRANIHLKFYEKFMDPKYDIPLWLR